MKRPRQKDNKHLDFVRGLPCVACANDVGTEAAHLRAGALKYGKRPSGTAEKPSDKWTLPLCSSCHREQHTGRELDFWEKLGIDPFVLAMSLFDVSGDWDINSDH